MSTPGGEQIGEAHIEVDMDTTRATLALREFSRDAQGRLHDIRGRFIAEGAQISRSLENSTRDTDRFGLSLRGLSTSMGPLAGILGKVSLGVGQIGAAAGTALPLVASVVTALEQIAPAGAVAVTAFLAVQQATQTIKLGMIGVQDTVSAAFDSSEAGAKKFQASLDKLAPSAREFALTVKSLVPAFTDFQQSIQDKLFFGFSDALTALSTSVLPVLKTNLEATARTLNDVALNTAVAAAQLATNGTLGKAMEGANAGLTNLAGVPALVVTGLGQLAVAAAPAFARVTDAAAGAAVSISDKLSKAFASGGLEDAINQAIDVLSGLGDIAGNVFGILGNVLGAASTGGDGLFQVLTSITQTLETASGTKGFQDAIGALVQTMGVFADTAGPLLGQVLAVLGPVFVGLATPVQTLIQALGAGLTPIITGLGPVLEGAAQAVGAIVVAFSPLLPILGDLIASLLPPLLPILDTITQAFTDAAPLIVQLGDAFVSVLAPAITQLSTNIFPLLDVFTQLTAQLLPVLSDLIVQLLPVFTSFIGSISGVQGQLIGLVAQILPQLANLFVQLAPSIIQVVTAMIGLETAVLPVVGLLVQAIAFVLPIMSQWIGLLAQVAAVLVDLVAGAITNVVIPVINTLVALFSGDFSGALTALGALLSGVWTQIATTVSGVGGLISTAVDTIIGIFQYLYDVLVGHSIIPDLIGAVVGWFSRLPGMAAAALVTLGSSIAGKATEAAEAMLKAIRRGVDSVAEAVGKIPGRATTALGDLGTLLYKSGKSLIQGFIDGIKYMLGAAEDAASSVVDAVGKYFPGSPAKEGRFSGRGWTLYSGQATVEAFGQGMRDQMAAAIRSAGTVTGAVQATISTPAAHASVSGMLANVTNASRMGASASAAPNVSVGAPQVAVTVKIGDKVITDMVQVVVDRSIDAVARQIAQGVRN